MPTPIGVAMHLFPRTAGSSSSKISPSWPMISLPRSHKYPHFSFRTEWITRWSTHCCLSPKWCCCSAAFYFWLAPTYKSTHLRTSFSFFLFCQLIMRSPPTQCGHRCKRGRVTCATGAKDTGDRTTYLSKSFGTSCTYRGIPLPSSLVCCWMSPTMALVSDRNLFLQPASGSTTNARS
jgi:hypothetical protein